MMIAEGRHPARAVDLQFGQAETGTEQVVVTFEIVEGAHSRELITWFGALTDKAAEFTLKSLAVMGWPKGKSLDQLGVEDIDSLVHLVVEHDSYQGKTRPRVKWINRPGRGGFQVKHKIEGSDLRKLSAKWKALADKTERYDKIEAPAPSAPAPSAGADSGHPYAPGYDGPGPDEFGDDDVPF